MLTIKFINPRCYSIDTMSSGQEIEHEAKSQEIDEDEARLAEADAQEIYSALRNRRSNNLWEIKKVLGIVREYLEDLINPKCACGKSVHHLSEFVGYFVKIKEVKTIYYGGDKTPLVLIDLEDKNDELHQAYVVSKTVARKLRRLLRKGDSVYADIKLEYDFKPMR